MSIKPVIFGCLGTVLTQEEKYFMRDANPWGFILFARNIETPLQVQRLVGDLCDSVGRKAAVLIDQEGGRVARLKQPYWREWSSVKQLINTFLSANEHKLVALEEKKQQLAQALTDRYHAIGQELYALGIDVNCVPLLDVPQIGAHDIIGDRALGDDVNNIITYARAVISGCTKGGVMHIIKHIPGHGRAGVDSHLDLPVVTSEKEELETDFAPFKAFQDSALAMTAHIIYTAYDDENCATCSPTVVKDVIRQNIGYNNLLMTDDLSMHALKGSFSTRTHQALNAGCDIILHCNGKRTEMEQILSEAPDLTGLAKERATKADNMRESLYCDTDRINPKRLLRAGMTYNV